MQTSPLLKVSTSCFKMWLEVGGSPPPVTWKKFNMHFIIFGDELYQVLIDESHPSSKILLIKLYRITLWSTTFILLRKNDVSGSDVIFFKSWNRFGLILLRSEAWAGPPEKNVFHERRTCWSTREGSSGPWEDLIVHVRRTSRYTREGPSSPWEKDLLVHERTY